MLNLQSLDLRRLLIFDEAHFDFHKGVTMVGGANKSGKSLLFSALHDAIYRNRESPLPSNSVVEVNYRQITSEDTSNDYRYIAKSNKLSFFENGEDRQPHKIEDALALVRRSFSITHPLYTSTVWLRGTKEHDLLKGKPSERSEWLSHVLDLITVYDAYHEQVSARLSDLQHIATSHRTLMEELDAATRRLPENTSNLTKEAAEKAERKLERLAERKSEIADRLVTIANQLSQLRLAPATYVEVDGKELRKEMKAADRDVDLLKEEYEAAVSYESANASELTKKAQKLYDQIGPYLEREPYKELTKKLADYQVKLDAYEDQLSLYRSQSSLREKKQRIREEKIADDYTVDDLSALEKNIAKLQVTMDKAREEGSRFRALDGSVKTCPTCGSKVDQKHIAKELDRLEKEYKKASAEYKRLKPIVAAIDILAQPTVKKPDDAIVEKYRKVRSLLDKIEQYEQLSTSAEVALTRKPKRSAEKVEDLLRRAERKARRLEKEYEQAAKVNAYLMSAEAWAIKVFKQGEVASTIAALTRENDELSRQQEDLIREHAKLQSSLMNYRVYQEARKSHRSTTARLTEKLAVYQDQLADMEPLKALMQAFGNSGLRLSELRESAHVLSSKMTELSPLFFSEQYDFELKVEPRKLTMLIKRNGIIGGLSSMSGSESRLFSLLFAMSLMYILPHRLRSDTIILDELEANLDVASRDRYCQDILPELERLAPKVVVVTPLINGELSLKPDRFYRVQKTTKGDRAVSRILEG